LEYKALLSMRVNAKT